MTKRLLFLACLSGAFAVIFGAFGAHILKKILSETDLATFKTGVDYQFYHTFAILMAAMMSRYASKKWTNIAGWLFVFGILFFSGSLYLLSTAYAFDFEFLKPLLGPVTPIGGLLFIGGWLALFFAATTYKSRGGSHHHRSSKKQ
ncbi:MAG TPA: DUF423 domain-containing protein [Bacteroidetes bacterium]|nr:DUF423 domain-containing protein [Bacteroidota bacterium]